MLEWCNSDYSDGDKLVDVIHKFKPTVSVQCVLCYGIIGTCSYCFHIAMRLSSLTSFFTSSPDVLIYTTISSSPSPHSQVLLGLSTQGGLFDETVIKAMHQHWYVRLLYSLSLCVLYVCVDTRDSAVLCCGLVCLITDVFTVLTSLFSLQC